MHVPHEVHGATMVAMQSPIATLVHIPVVTCESNVGCEADLVTRCNKTNTQTSFGWGLCRNQQHGKPMAREPDRPEIHGKCTPAVPQAP